MCSKSETIGKIASALVKFSGDVKAIEKDGTNPHFKSSYTTLDHMIDATKPILQKHGLTVMQFPGGDGEKITIRTMILHESGEWIESEPLVLRPVKNDPQGAGSAITYGRRYSYAAALSLSLGDDDDGNAASTPTTSQQVGQKRLEEEKAKATQRQQNTSQGQSGTSQMISQAQIGYAHKLKSEKKISDEDFTRIVAEHGEGVTSIKDLSKGQGIQLINFLNNYTVQEELPIG